MSRYPLEPPSDEFTANGSWFLCAIARDGPASTGSITKLPDGEVWHYREQGNRFWKPSLILSDANGSESLTVSRVSYLPPVWRLVERDRPAGTIRLASPLRNKYRIEIGGTVWTFRMPTFTVRFFGETASATGVWVLVWPSKMEWNVLVRPGVAEWPLIGAVAFIHNQWFRFS